LREDIRPLSIHVYKRNRISDSGSTVNSNIKRKEVLRLSKASEYEARTERMITPILERLGFELVDVEYVKEGSMWYLRAYIDKEGGITVNDCETVAREMNTLLDEADFIPDSYTFEVSSPGLGRPLKKEKDFIRNLGKQVEIRTYRSINRSKDFCGELKAYDDGSVTIVTDEGEELVFEKTDIALIRQAIDF
jgi:ribosome maturation factor RimP